MYDSGRSSRKIHCGEGQVEGKRVSEGQRVRKRDEDPGGKKVPSPPGQGVLYILSWQDVRSAILPSLPLHSPSSSPYTVSSLFGFLFSFPPCHRRLFSLFLGRRSRDRGKTNDQKKEGRVRARSEEREKQLGTVVWRVSLALARTGCLVFGADSLKFNF